jgi:hypothetical protein
MSAFLYGAFKILKPFATETQRHREIQKQEMRGKSTALKSYPTVFVLALPQKVLVFSLLLFLRVSVSLWQIMVFFIKTLL